MESPTVAMLSPDSDLFGRLGLQLGLYKEQGAAQEGPRASRQGTGHRALVDDSFPIFVR